MSVNILKKIMKNLMNACGKYQQMYTYTYKYVYDSFERDDLLLLPANVAEPKKPCN